MISVHSTDTIILNITLTKQKSTRNDRKFLYEEVIYDKYLTIPNKIRTSVDLHIK